MHRYDGLIIKIRFESREYLSHHTYLLGFMSVCLKYFGICLLLQDLRVMSNNMGTLTTLYIILADSVFFCSCSVLNIL